MPKTKSQTEIKDQIMANYSHHDIITSMGPKMNLVAQRVRRFAWHTRHHCRVYLVLEEGGD